MKSPFSQSLHLSAAALAAAAFCLAPTAFASSTVTLTTADNIQTKVNAYPAGTSFILTAGMYRNQSVVPKEGDSFSGQGDVRMTGSILLTFKEDSGTKLWVASATPDNTVVGTCQSTYPLCHYSQDLFIGGTVQKPVTSMTDMKSGQWYFDRSTSKIYIPSNPGAAVTELGMAKYAFAGTVPNVTIKNMMIQKYASNGQSGAIGLTGTGPNWTVDNVEVRYNHGVGVKLGSGSKLTNSFIHDNGELGISLQGTNSEGISNEISWNNYAGYAFSWESGGGKFSSTTNLLLQSNYVHDNYGPGLWGDTDNVSTTYDSNTVTHNEECGIQHELSFSAIIKNNTLSGNGYLASDWLWNGQILIENSSNVQIYDNTVEVPVSGANGISIINQNRGSGPLGPWIAANNTVHNNSVTYLGAGGGSGMVDDTGSHPILGNSFNSNKYYLTTGSMATSEHWWWFSIMTFSKFQGNGEELSGTAAMVAK